MATDDAGTDRAFGLTASQALTILFVLTLTGFVLTEHFREIPGALAAFAAAWYVVNVLDRR